MFIMSDFGTDIKNSSWHARSSSEVRVNNELVL